METAIEENANKAEDANADQVPSAEGQEADEEAVENAESAEGTSDVPTENVSEGPADEASASSESEAAAKESYDEQASPEGETVNESLGQPVQRNRAPLEEGSEDQPSQDKAQNANGASGEGIAFVVMGGASDGSSEDENPADEDDNELLDEDSDEEGEEGDEALEGEGNGLVSEEGGVSADGAPVMGFTNKRRNASFETKLKGSEFDLRHKYYDLRDYIKSFGVNNRISRQGDTFSLHREKLVFITISGKRLKLAFALDPKDYEESAIPFTVNTSKKFEDMPFGFKVKSDLSFRRAKKLVDDVMAKKGYTRNDGN